MRMHEAIPPPPFLVAIQLELREHGDLISLLQPGRLPEEKAISIAFDGVQSLAAAADGAFEDDRIPAPAHFLLGFIEE